MKSKAENQERYELIVDEGLRQEFVRLHGIIRYGFIIGFDKRARMFFLLRDDSTGFRIFTDMVTLGPRLEAGRIHIERAEDWRFSIAQTRELPSEFVATTFEVERLVITDGAGVVDSGLTLKTPEGNEIVLVASSAPHGIECCSNPTLLVPDEKFQPEYELHEYQRIPF